MSRKTIETFGAAVLLLMAVPSAMSLRLVGLPGMVLMMMMMMTDMASLAVRNLMVLALVAMFALGHWLALQDERKKQAPDAHKKAGSMR
jgi:hypothetical protein